MQFAHDPRKLVEEKLMYVGEDCCNVDFKIDIFESIAGVHSDEYTSK